jgi:hypothetical protein
MENESNWEDVVTIWQHNWNFTSTALSVVIKKETDKAFQFAVAENPKMTFWLPKKALQFDEDKLAIMARWCKPDEWYYRAVNRYAFFHKR